MTVPMIFGLGMTLNWLLLYRLKPKSWRKWLGLALLISSAIAFFNLSDKSHETFAALVMLFSVGCSLFAARDQFTQEED